MECTIRLTCICEGFRLSEESDAVELTLVLMECVEEAFDIYLGSDYVYVYIYIIYILRCW